ncbi:monocarboxylate transporter 12-like [Patiria miniata]|uniref:Major facilitator superfamily (MFS) profile domain-containing protein n=1 Tax=Patiria miniata TaxID=46514 RepID=A0A913ZQC3_PATMI|nr:monocarboxylate transporter 12-like [Patiria miniata]
MGRVQASRSHQGWYAVLCLFVSNVLWMWLIKGLGVMLPTLQQQFAAQTWLVGWMISIVSTVICVFVGLPASTLEVMFGIRTVVTVSGFMLGVSMIIASFSPSIVMLTLILVLLAGPALSIVPILTRAQIARRFKTNYGTAEGIGMSGYAVGLITAGPFAQLLLDTYGWRGALLILGGFALHLGVCGALLRSPSTDESKTNSSYQLVSNEEPRLGSSSAEKKGNLKQSSLPFNTFKDVLKAMMKHFGFSVCFRVSFWITTVTSLCALYVDDYWLIYYVSQAEAKGFSPYDAVTFTTAGGVGNIVSGILLGFIVDRNVLKLRPALALSIILSSLALLIAPWVNSYWLMMTGAFVFCGGNGAIALLNDLYTRELLGTDLLVYAFAWMEMLTAILGFSLGFFPGWINDQTGSFDWAFFTLGCISGLSLVALLIERVLAKYKPQQTA